MIKKKLKKLILVMVGFAFSINLYAQNVDYNYSFWEPIANAISYVESKHNPNARNGIYVGCMQISPGMVNECNNILKRNGETRRFSMNDRLNAKKSKEMFAIFQSYHNPNKNIERAIRMWNGGPRFSASKTNRYYYKVMAAYNQKS